MTEVRSRSIASLLVVAGLLGIVAPVGAQQPRTRSLKYNPDRKEWIEVPPPPPGTAEGDLYHIRVLVKNGENRSALAAIKRFIKSYGAANVHYPEALLEKAQALIGRRDYHQAYVQLEEFLNQFAGIALTDEALRLEFVIAETYLSGVKRKLWGLRWLSGEDLAYQILDDISVNYPDSEHAEYAVKAKADHLFRKGEYGLAELEYARLLRDYPHTRYHRHALGKSAAAALAGFAGVEYDDAALIEAEERYRDYQARYGAVADREGVQEILENITARRAEKEFSIGAYYERTGHLSSAVFYYQSVRVNWPDTIAAAKAAARLELLEAPGPAASVGGARRTG